jgi:homoserine O-acetyltransferase
MSRVSSKKSSPRKASPRKSLSKKSSSPSSRESKSEKKHTRVKLSYTEYDFEVSEYKFNDGNTLKNVILHYITLGSPKYDSYGEITNAILFLHGTAGSAQNMLTKNFMKYMYAPGKPLDISVYYVILPDCIGHGKSSKPEGKSGKFPHYNYDDAVTLQHLLITEELQINHLNLVMGISMGGMHTWLWSIMYPEFMTGAMPIVCLPEKITGRNLLWRRMLIRGDADGSLFAMMLDGVFNLEKEITDIKSCDEYIEKGKKQFVINDEVKYALDSSRDYDPKSYLQDIETSVFALNFSDDELNPAQLHVLEKAMPKVRNGYYLIQEDESYGHSTGTYPQLWGKHLAKFLNTLSSKAR